MKKMIAALGATVLCGGAQASVQFAFQNATLFTSTSGGTAVGTLTGTFTTNDALTTIQGYNLTASPSGGFVGFTYTTLNSAVTASSLPSQYFRIDDLAFANELQVYFTSGLTANGGTVGTSQSYEHEPAGGNRYIVNGTVTRVATAAVPEPASWALMVLGFGAIGSALRRRKIAVSFA